MLSVARAPPIAMMQAKAGTLADLLVSLSELHGRHGRRSLIASAAHRRAAPPIAISFVLILSRARASVAMIRRHRARSTLQHAFIFFINGDSNLYSHTRSGTPMKSRSDASRLQRTSWSITPPSASVALDVIPAPVRVPLVDCEPLPDHVETVAEQQAADSFEPVHIALSSNPSSRRR